MTHSYILDTKKLLENSKIFIIVLKLCVHVSLAHECECQNIPLELVMDGGCELPSVGSGTCFGPLQEQYTEPSL